MDDSKSTKPRGVPSGQIQEPSMSEPSEKGCVENPDNKVIVNEPRRTLLGSAAKFLDDEDIRNAPKERKKVFLESKGLKEDEIQDLLREQQQEQHAPEAEVMEDYGIEKEEVRLQSSDVKPDAEGRQFSSTTNNDLENSKVTSTSPDGQPPSYPSPKDIPPIITYPEFLIHSQKPPPLITARRLLTILYVASGAAATIYGTSKYIVEPMIESLTSARQSLAEIASSNINTLNTKLESAVSKIPDNGINCREEDHSDIESIDSHPSRFFSRSAATQTSPHRSHSLSSKSSEESTPTDSIPNHGEILSAIHDRLSDLQPEDSTGPAKDSISDLRKFLDTLPYTNASQQNALLWEKNKSDEYGKLKAEIRGIKGVLLSARNFPSGVSVR